MTEKFIGTLNGVDFFRFTQTRTVDIDTFVTTLDIKGFDKEGNRVFFLREILYQLWTGETMEQFKIKQNKGVDLQAFKKTFDNHLAVMVE